ncbi:hypothetical protein WN944_020432 [Citrus x changshan-huyou]|uniref:Uncharacterized protein n=1 Tax=Citrus x changshan-huyou TaxID=2935761 RepID=A0AAP0M036_9ROSI
MSPLPVFWSIGSRPKLERRGNSGCWVQAYNNGNVYDGLMANMMDMESRLRAEGADIGANMSGLMGRVMDVEFILVRMEVDYVGKFKWGSIMALAITILVFLLRNGETYGGEYLRKRSMDLMSIILPMGIGMKEPGMRV